MCGCRNQWLVRLLAAATVLLWSTAASAQSSRFSYVSKPGDPIGQGSSLVLERDISAWRLTDEPYDGVFIGAYNDARPIYLTLRTPNGGKLTPKVYSGAVAFDGDPRKPGLTFYNSERQCTSSSGAFEVLDAKWGPFDYIERLHVRFKQTCTGAPAGSYGEVVIRNPPPPPIITGRVVWDRKAVLSAGGWITLRGTYTCSKENGDIGISTRARQVTPSGKILVGEMEAREDYLLGCGPAPRRVERIIYPTNCKRFITGPARVIYSMYLGDPFYNRNFSTRHTADVTVVRGY